MGKLQSRRDFLKVAAAGSLGAVLASQTACNSAANKAVAPVPPVADPKSFGVCLQMYTVRDAMEKDAVLALTQISKIGYKYLELANYEDGKFYGFTPKEFKKIVNDLGMEIPSSHTQVEAKGITLENAQKMADDHAELGVEYCVQPWINAEDRTLDKYRKMIADWNQVGEIMKGNGIKFGYHNHNFEFKNHDGIVPYYDIFLKDMDPELITMELDFFWAVKAGQDPVEIINKYPGRFELFHMKDQYTTEEPFFEPASVDMAPVGAGNIDFKRILDVKDVAGMKYLIVEQDCSFTDIKTSIYNLTTNILA